MRIPTKSKCAPSSSGVTAPILARSGEEALELLAVQSVDCILLDLVMPGLGGQETCLRVKATPLLRDIPLVMVTAREDQQSMVEGLGAGADDFIPKSSDFEVLRARVRAQIRRKQFEDETRRIRKDLLAKELEATEARASRMLAETRAVLVDELERKNKELEAFSYSLSHDLRTPLRGIDGFSQILLDDYSDRLDDQGRDYLRRVRRGAQRMGALIEDMLYAPCKMSSAIDSFRTFARTNRRNLPWFDARSSGTACSGTLPPMLLCPLRFRSVIKRPLGDEVQELVGVVGFPQNSRRSPSARLCHDLRGGEARH